MVNIGGRSSEEERAWDLRQGLCNGLWTHACLFRTMWEGHQGEEEGPLDNRGRAGQGRVLKKGQARGRRGGGALAAAEGWPLREGPHKGGSAGEVTKSTEAGRKRVGPSWG